MRKVIGVTHIKRLSLSPTQQDYPNQICQGHSKDQQGLEHSPDMRMFSRIEVRENREDRQEIADQVTSGVAQENRCLGKIIGQKSEERSAGRERDQCHEILAL